MQKVAIVTDSTACLSPELAARYGIEVAPTELAFEGKVYRDGIDPPGDFYDLLRKAKRPPTTSAPSPGRFLEAYARAAKRAEAVLCVTLPVELSSTHNVSRQAIMLAKEELPNVRIMSVAAPAVASGQGLVAIEASLAAKEGRTLEEMAAYVESLAPKVHFFAALDTLEYLAKGGHVPKAAAWLGDLIGFKPILTAYYGRVDRLSQTRTKKNAIHKMLQLMAERNPERLPLRALVMHADSEAEAGDFAAEIKRRFLCEEMLITQFTPVMAAHSGPGVVGVAFRCLEREGAPAAAPAMAAR
jgi:DegV family protein with EDD domain